VAQVIKHEWHRKFVKRADCDGRPRPLVPLACRLPCECMTFDTCASLLIREGASIKAVQHHLGHKSASITLDRYGHLFPEELDHLADRLDRVHAQAGVYPACTDASVAALGQGKGPGR
jgi:hypothetical protein